MADTPKIKPGDWVRFYRDARLVIGCVQYVKQDDPNFGEDEVCTDLGSTSADAILEVRSER